HHGSLIRAFGCLYVPYAAFAPNPRHTLLFEDVGPGAFRRASEGGDHVVGVGVAVVFDPDAAQHMMRHAGHEFTHGVLVGPGLMSEAECFQFGNACLGGDDVGFSLAHLKLAAGNESAIVAHKRLETVPDKVARGERQRNFGDVTEQGAHAASVYARRVAPAVFRFEHPYRDTAACQMHGARKPLQAATDNDDVTAAAGGRYGARMPALRSGGSRKMGGSRHDSICAS